MKTTNLSLSIIASLTFAAASIALPAHAAPVGAEGSKCTVTSGANQGKSGTVTTESDDNGGSHSWCEGSWGATECTGSNKCAAAQVVSGVGGLHLIGKPIIAVPTTLSVSRAATQAR